MNGPHVYFHKPSFLVSWYIHFISFTNFPYDWILHQLPYHYNCFHPLSFRLLHGISVLTTLSFNNGDKMCSSNATTHHHITVTWKLEVSIISVPKPAQLPVFSSISFLCPMGYHPLRWRACRPYFHKWNISFPLPNLCPKKDFSLFTVLIIIRKSLSLAKLTTPAAIFGICVSIMAEWNAATKILRIPL